MKSLVLIILMIFVFGCEYKSPIVKEKAYVRNVPSAYKNYCFERLKGFNQIRNNSTDYPFYQELRYDTSLHVIKHFSSQKADTTKLYLNKYGEYTQSYSFYDSDEGEDKIRFEYFLKDEFYSFELYLNKDYLQLSSITHSLFNDTIEKRTVKYGYLVNFQKEDFAKGTVFLINKVSDVGFGGVWEQQFKKVSKGVLYIRKRFWINQEGTKVLQQKDSSLYNGSYVCF